MLYRIIIVLAICATASCKSLHTIEGEYNFAQNPDKGLVVLSTRVDTQCSHGGTLYFRDKDHKTSGLFLMSNPLVAKDFSDPDGYFFIRPLPEGEYVIDTMKLTHYSGPVNASFSVKAGKVTYIGQFYVVVPNCRQFRLMITDEWERDVELFKAKVKNLRPEDVDKQISINRRKQSNW